MDIDKLMEGAASGRQKALDAPYESNAALQYAAVRATSCTARARRLKS